MLVVDTDVVVDLLNQDPEATRWMSRLADEIVGMTGFSILELIEGCKNAREARELEQKLARFVVFWPTAEDCGKARRNFAQLHLQHGTGIIDALIGYTALGLGVTLYTFNQKHYRGIEGLVTMRPYSRRRRKRSAVS